MFSSIFFLRTQRPVSNSEYWRLLVYFEFDSARNTLNQTNPLTVFSDLHFKPHVNHCLFLQNRPSYASQR